jgi:FkbM family methyltransferase
VIDVQKESGETRVSVGGARNVNVIGPTGSLEMERWARIQLNRMAKARRVARALVWARHNRSLPKPRLLDIGARGGLQSKWEPLRRLGIIESVLTEPDSTERDRLKASCRQVQILPYAVGGKEETCELFLTRNPGLSSIRKPLFSTVEIVAEASEYEVVRKERVNCMPLSALRKSNVLDRCHFLKIDTQGMEYDILTGLGDYVDEIIGIELECRFLSVYDGEKTSDMTIEYLFSRNFDLMALRPLGLSRRGIIEANLVFTRTGRLDRADEAYRDLYDRVLGLTRDGFSLSIKSE